MQHLNIGPPVVLNNLLLSLTNIKPTEESLKVL